MPLPRCQNFSPFSFFFKKLIIYYCHLPHTYEPVQLILNMTIDMSLRIVYIWRRTDEMFIVTRVVNGKRFSVSLLISLSQFIYVFFLISLNQCTKFMTNWKSCLTKPICTRRNTYSHLLREAFRHFHPFSIAFIYAFWIKWLRITHTFILNSFNHLYKI